LKAEGVEGRSFTTTYGDRIFIELLADNKTYNIIRKLLVSHHFNN
jgi:predicted small integral membrane protein